MSKKKNSPVASIGFDTEWQAQEDMRTLMRAHEIKKDPKRHARAVAAAKKQMGEIKAVASKRPA